MDEKNTPKKYSIAEYKSLEVNEPLAKYEYYDGNVFNMAGGTYEHNLIISNTLFSLRVALGKKSPCKVLTSDMKVEIKEYNSYVYPDILVFCGQHTNTGMIKDSISNPKLIVEVLSDSTELNDRKGKFSYYKSLPSFEEYILIRQKPALIDTYFRDENDMWVIGGVQKIEDNLHLRSLDISIPMEDIYEGVSF